MNKGFNTRVEETKTELLNFVNQKLQEGLPLSVLSLIVENILKDVKMEIPKVLEQERKQNEAEREVEILE